MGPSLSMRDHGSFVRPSTRDRPMSSRAGTVKIEDDTVPSRTSSLHSRFTAPIPQSVNPKAVQHRMPKTLTHAYMVCGVGREPSQWVRAPAPLQGKIGHMKNAVGQFWMPEILGSSPRLEQDNEIARLLHTAMKACFPHDVEVCMGKTQPHCVHHTFVLQQDSAHTYYGIALRVWSRADEKRASTIRDLRRRTEHDFYEGAADETYWIPYCLGFLSRYPLYDLLGDYLRGMWIHWNKATNLFHAEEVSRILSFPAPRLNDLVRIDMKDYALCYQFPSSPTGFQNFALWPLFTCLSIPNIVGVVEAAVSTTRRLIFVSHHPAMLTVAAEAVRHFVRVYEWNGLYAPIVHARHVTDLVQEPGPYILGLTSECRTLFTAPADALVIDLDRNFVLTSSPPSALSPKQRTKMVSRLTQALNGDVTTSGVPNHLRSAYGGGKLIPAGQIIVMRGEVESVRDPAWWNQDNVMTVMDHVCEKLGRNTGIKAIFTGTVKKPLMTKISLRHLNEIVRERNQYSRDTAEAWQDYINLKGRLDTEVTKVNKRNNFLVEELDSWKQQFLKFQAFAEQLTKETQDLKVKIEGHKRDARRLGAQLEAKNDEMARMSLRLTGTEKQRDDALEALILQQAIAEELERERRRSKKELQALQLTNRNVIRQREEAQRVVVHLRSLISGQTHHMEHLVRSLYSPPEPAELAAEESPEEALGPAGAADDAAADGEPGARIRLPSGRSSAQLRRLSRRPRLGSPRNSIDQSSGSGNADASALNSPSSGPSPRAKRFSDSFSTAAFADLSDRHLRDKTDAIAHIIRNISDQCAAAVEGLQLAHNAEQQAELDRAAAAAADDDALDAAKMAAPPPRARPGRRSPGGPRTPEPALLEELEEEEERDGGASTVVSAAPSSVPPTPDLVHRASTAMSLASSMGTAPGSGVSEQQRLRMSGGGGEGGAAGDAAQPRIAEDDESVSGSVASGSNASGSLLGGANAGARPRVVGAAGPLAKTRKRLSGLKPGLFATSRVLGQ